MSDVPSTIERIFEDLWEESRRRYSPQLELALLARALWRAGYNDETRGHITYRQPDGTVLMNRYGPTWAELRPEDVVAIDKQGRPAEIDTLITPAVRIHLAMHARRPDVRVVVHHHSEYGTVWAGARQVPPVYDQNGAYIGPDDLLLYDEYTGSFDNQAAAERTAAAVGTADYVLLGNHGVMVCATEIWQAYWRAYLLEWRCRLAWRVKAMGESSPMPQAAQMALRSNLVGAGAKNVLPWDAAARRELSASPDLIMTPSRESASR